MTNEKYDKGEWFDYFRDGDLVFGKQASLDTPVDTISAPTAKQIYKTDYQAVNKLDSLLYQRERRVISYTDYQLWRTRLEEEAQLKTE